MVKVIIFDFDGVIVNSPKLKHQAFLDLFIDADPLKKQIAYEIIEKTRGQPRYEKFRQIFTALNYKPKEAENLVQIYTQKYNRLSEKLIIEKGVPTSIMQTLDALSKNYTLYINSTTPQASLRQLVEKLGIDKFFKAVLGLPPRRTKASGTKEENLWKIFRRENINPEEAVFVGDSQQDLEAAKLFGCPFIGVTNRINGWENTGYPLVSKLPQLKKILSKQFPNEVLLFTPNNHSKYRIFWNTIPQKQQATLKKLISTQYHLNSQETIKQVDEWETRSNNFQIKVKDGSKIKKVVLRKHIRFNDPKRIILIDKVLNFLAQKGTKVPKVIKTDNGKDLFFENGHYWQLFQFTEGDHFKGTINQLKQTAQEIAKLHLALKLCKIPLPKIDIDKSANPIDWKRIIDIARKKNQISDQVFISNIDFILENFMLSSEKLQKSKGLRTQIIRGDLHPHDTIFAKNKFESFLDFEGMKKSQLARDVANACHRFTRQYVVYQKKPWIKTLPYAIKTFLNEYQKINPLNEKESALLPFFIIDETLGKIYRILARHYIQQTALDQNELKKQLVLLKEAKIIERIMAIA